MLLNNFKPLISFYNGAKFVNVLGAEVAKTTILCGNSNSNTNLSGTNSHNYGGSTLSYNYTTTAAANNFTKEQTTYNWLGVVGVSASSGNPNYISARFNGFVLFIGTGNKEVQADDYCLDNAIELKVTASSCYHNADEKTIVSRSFYNNTEEDVEIKEIGLYFFMSPCGCVSNYTSSFVQPIVMVGRKVFETPITIQKGEQYTFNYTIDMSQVSFEEADR